MAYLRIANLKKTYQVSRTEKQEVLKGVNAEFKRGEFVALLGESGCGKSTLINLIGGLDFEYTGSIVLDGFFLKDFTEKELDDYRKKKIGFIFQNYNLIKHMTVLENVTIAMTMSSVSGKERIAKAKELLKQVGIEEFHNKLPNQLSGGQKQRVAIARALANDPEIILADEPTGSLDKNSAQAIIEILTKISESGKLVLCVTHSQKVASNCSRILRLDDGVVVEDEKIRSINTRINRQQQIKPKSIGFKELLKLSIKNLLQTKDRSILVAVGMSIGIAAVVFMFGLSSGIKTYANDTFATAMNKMQIDVVKDTNATETFTNSEIEFLYNLEGVDTIESSTNVSMQVEYKEASESDDDYRVLLTLSSVFDSLEVSMVSGDYPEDGEIMVSDAMEEKVGSSLLGETIMLNYDGNVQSYTVSGIYTISSTYDTAYLTDSDLDELTNNEFDCNIIYVFAEDITYVDALVTDIDYLGYIAYRQDTSVEELIEYVDLGTTVLTAVAGISILVSAIMIFIVLYISVVERTKEIGVLRAIGARKKDIRNLFTFEAGVLGAIGGTIGCLISLLIGIVTNVTLASTFSGGLVDNNVLYYLIAILGSMAISIISGLSPAFLASNSDPVECLRYE